jgi:hypothetical protein
MQQSVLLRELQKEIRRHDLSTFVEDPPSDAQGGKRRHRTRLPLLQGNDSAQSHSSGPSDERRFYPRS